MITTRTILQKLKSTKLWLAVAGAATGIYLALGGEPDKIQTVAGAVTALVSLVTYIITEGKIDDAAVGKTTKTVEDVVDMVKEEGD